MKIEDLAKEIENLAGMVQRGFKEQTTNLNEFKDEMYEFKDEMYTFKSSVDSKFSQIQESLSDLNPSLRALKLSDGDLEKRVTKIEHKLGMA